MATLTDEEKAAAILGEEVEPTGDETSAEDTDLDQPEEDAPEVEEPDEDDSEEEKPKEDKDDSEEPADSTFTKQFPNLKGETLQDYNQELETAYDNSFKEALRLNDVIKEKDKTIQDNATIVEQARQIVAQAQAPVTQPGQPAPAVSTTPEVINTTVSPEVQWIRNERRRTMMSAFDDFKKDYPQVLDQQEFDRFSKASDGIKAALQASTGQEPTDIEIFKAVAGSFGWQSADKDAKKDAAIKENASISRTPSSGTQSAPPPKKSKVSDAQIEAYQKMFTSKTREDAIKELSEVV